MTASTLAPTTIIALSKQFAPTSKLVKDARKLVPVGTVTVNAVVALEGELKVGADYPTTPTVSVPLLRSLCLLAQRAGFQGPAALALIGDVLADVLADDGLDANKALADLTKDAEEQLKTLRTELTDKLPKQPRKGACSFKGAVGGVEVD